MCKRKVIVQHELVVVFVMSLGVMPTTEGNAGFNHVLNKVDNLA